MAGLNYDPVMLASLMANMPETQRRSRRAKKLRGRDFEDIETGLAMMGGADPMGEVEPGMEDFGFGPGLNPFARIPAGTEDYGYGPGAGQFPNVQGGMNMAGGAEPQGAVGPPDFGPDQVTGQLAGTLGLPPPPQQPPQQPPMPPQQPEYPQGSGVTTSPMAPDQTVSAPEPLEQGFPAVNVEDMLRGTMQLPPAAGAVAGAAPGEIAGGEVPPEIMEEDQAAKMAIAEEETGRPAFDPESGLPDEVIRMHMALLDAPKVAGVSDDAGTDNFNISTKEDDKGNVWLIRKYGPPQLAGFKTNYNGKVITDTATGKSYIVGTSGSGRGVSHTVIQGAPPLPPEQEYTEIPTPGAGQGAAPVGPAGADDPEAWYQAVEQAESAGDQGAVSPVGARGVMQLMPDTARELEKSLGLPPGSTDVDENANRQAGRAYLDQRMQARNGDRTLALMDYNWGPGNVDRWIANGANPANVPAETVAYVERVTQRATGGAGRAMGGQTNVGLPATAAGAIPSATGGAPMGTQQVAGQPLQITPEAQAAGLKEAATRTATLDANAVQAAKDALPKAQAARRKAMIEVDRIRANPQVLRGIAGGTGTGVISAVPWIGDELAQGWVGMTEGGKPAADVMSALQTLTSSAFLQSYADALQGTGAISNIEGLRGAANNLQAALSQSPERIMERLDEYLKELQIVEDRLAEIAGAEGSPATGRSAAPAPARGAGAPKRSDDDLLKQYGG